ncbi:unnamed protein product [Cuscuta campestris]|uniref:Uncharacterized protein n=1 Tax=Cuscuta campestris TaxID=132261 RepID=A0A484KW96_9ASTE|nr:unnamed protein product [Cuscuta campestris]
MKPTEFIPFGSLPLNTSQRNPDSDSAEPNGNHGQPSIIPDHSNGDNSGNGDPVPIHPESPTNSVLQPEAELDQPINPNQHNLPKKADLNNDYKLVLELVIAGLECGSGGHADDITQERASIINALITKSKVNWAAHFFNSISKHLGKPNQKYLCQGLYIGHILESMGAASKGKKYGARYWLYYLSSKGENRAGTSAAAEESSSDNVPLINLTKTAKRKQVVSPSLSIEAPQNLVPVNLEEEEEVSVQRELQRKKKRKITSPSLSGNVNPDELKEKEPAEETSAHNQSPQQLEDEAHSLPTPSPQPQTDDADNQFWQLYYDWRVWKVGNSAEQLLGWDQQLKNEKIIKKCLGLPVNHTCQQILDDAWVWQRNYEDLHQEYLATTPVSEFEVDDEGPAVYKPVFSKATEDQMVLTSEAQANLEATAEDFQIFLETTSAFETSQVLEILTTACGISNQHELEIPEKLGEILEQSTFPETTEAQEEQAVEAQEEQAVEAQRNSAETEKETQMAELEASKSLVTNFHFHSSSIPTLPDEVPEIWTKKVQGLIEPTLASQHASFRQEIEQMEARYNQLIEKSEETHCSNLKEIRKSVDKILEIISLLSNSVSDTMETYASDSFLQLKEVNKIREQIANVTVSLQKQMSLLQMDIKSALAVSSANQVVTKDYLKVIIDNHKEAFRLFRHLSTNSGNRKMEVILQQHIPSLIPELPIAVKEGEISYIPSHLKMTDLILEAQRNNPKNSAQHLSSLGLDRTEAVGTIVTHFPNDNQTKERYHNIRRIKELCGNMQGIVIWKLDILIGNDRDNHLNPITFSKIKHLKTAMEIWQGLGKLCEGSEDLRKQKIEVLLEKFKSFKMLLGESFDMLDERYHKILNDLLSLNHVLSPKEKNSACPYPKVEKYGERERNEKKKKAMVAAESDKSSSSSSDEEALVCMERRVEKSNHEDRWTMSEDDTLCLMAKDDADQEVKSLNKELGIIKSKEAVDRLFETTKHKGREGLGFDPSSSKRKGRTTFIPPKPTAKPNKQKGKEKEKPTEVPKKVVPPKNYRKLDRPQKGNNFRRKPSNPHYTRGYTHYGVDRSFPRNSEWRTMPRYSHPPPQKMFVPPKYAYNRHRSHYAQPRQNYRSYARRDTPLANAHNALLSHGGGGGGGGSSNYNITDKHYWVSRTKTGIHGYVIVGIWLLCGVGFGSYIMIKNSSDSYEHMVDHPHVSDVCSRLPFRSSISPQGVVKGSYGSPNASLELIN